jgi:hypothetical protein
MMSKFFQKSTKFKNKRTIVDGINFSSKGEAFRYIELIKLQKFGFIKDLRLQVKYLIEINSVKICTYIADFVYFDTAKNKQVVEDFKGFKTPIYNLKKKLMKAVFSIDIFETKY